MNIYTLLSVGFIFTGTFTQLPAENQCIPYENLLAYILQQHGEEAFVTACIKELLIKQSLEKFQSVLGKVLAKADENKINKAELLKNMCQCLQQKIATIERLQATHIDWDELRKASILMMNALIFGATAYGIHKGHRLPDQSITQFILFSGSMSILFLIAAIFTIRDSFNPIREEQYEDRYLDTYKKFLDITKLFIRQHFHKGSLP